MKNTPKKVFILENGNYKELSYEDFCSFKENDISYADKLFIPLHGMLMEVTEETYRNFYKSKRRQKYIDERSAENNDFSYDMLTTDDFNGEDILADESEPLDEQVIRKIMTDKLKSALPLLAEDEQKLIREIFYEELSERTLAEKYGISQVAIHKRKVKILEKLKKMLKADSHLQSPLLIFLMYIFANLYPYILKIHIRVSFSAGYFYQSCDCQAPC